MKQHKLKTIEDITDMITHENITEFIADFEVYLKVIIETKQYPNGLFKADGLTWVDDGVKGVSDIVINGESILKK